MQLLRVTIIATAVVALSQLVAAGLATKSLSSDSCVVCSMSVPDCGACAADEKCMTTKQTCKSCPTAACKRVAPEECVMCSASVPECGACAADEKCVTTKQTCGKCPVASCKRVVAAPKPECVVCPAVVPECGACAADEKCMTTKQTCDKCPVASCKRVVAAPKPKPTYTPPTGVAVPPNCQLKCLVAPQCGPCAADEFCRIEAASCESCGRASCEKLAHLPKLTAPMRPPFVPKPAQAEQCNMKCLMSADCRKCGSNELCTVVVEDCNRCSSSSCAPRDN